MGDSSDSMSVDMESISSGGKVSAFRVSFTNVCLMIWLDGFEHRSLFACWEIFVLVGDEEGRS